MNLHKNALIFILICIQTLLAIAGGMAVLSVTSKNVIPAHVYIGSTALGGLSPEEALKRLEDQYDSKIKNDYFTITMDNGAEFKIKYGDVDASLDYAATIGKINGGERGSSLRDILSGNFAAKGRKFFPVVNINEGKLRGKLNELAGAIGREAKDADISLDKEGKVAKSPETEGLMLHVENAVTKVRAEIGSSMDSFIEFRTDNNFELQVQIPQVTIKDLEGADEVVAKIQSDRLRPEMEDSVNSAATAINKVLIFPADIKQGMEAGVFSFNKYLGMENKILDKADEGYNQVASALFAAVLSAGIKSETITRTPHKTPVDYISPGLDAAVLGNATDFKFKNTLEYPVVIFADVKDGKLNVSLVSTRKDRETENSLRVEIEQRFEPPVINLENQDLAPGQKKLIKPGKEGVKVSVYSITKKNGTELERKYLHSDTYDAVEAMVQVGPNTKWDGKIIK